MTPLFLRLFVDAIYLQPYLWLLLLRSSVKLDMRLFYGAGAAALVGLVWSGFGTEPFMNDLLISYVLMVMYAAWRQRGGYPIHAVSLAFLIVFINSYLWEFPIHIMDFATNLDYSIQLTQLLHLPPLIFLLAYYRPMLELSPRSTAVYRVLALWVLVSAAVVYGYYAAWPPTWAVNHILRWASLLTFLSLVKLKPNNLI